MIIDEADFFVLDDPVQTDKLLGSVNIIGVTATVSDAQFKEIEEQVFKDLDFAIYHFSS